MNALYTLITILPVWLSPESPQTDTLSYDMTPVTVSAAIKHNGLFTDAPMAVSAFRNGQLEQNRIDEPKALSLIVPNFLQADYGSKMTSSMYIRGIGARMEQPAIGLYLDNIPLMNKNGYDQDLYDIGQIYFLRGPQGTLYGRNTMGGVIDIHTRSPMYHQGTRLQAGYGNGNSSELQFSTACKPTPDFAFSLALSHRYSDGFFTNRYDGSSADRILSESGRLRTVYRIDPDWTMENTLLAGYVRQRGFAYAQYDEQTGQVALIDHNDPCTYERFTLTDGLTFRYHRAGWDFSSTTSYQFTDDDMVMDQDFRPVSIFTLRQTQKEHALTQELVLRTDTQAPWQWMTGIFGFYKHNRMRAPVTFKRDGIDQLILDNANAGISAGLPGTGAALSIREESFPIESLFKLPVWGASLYHQSTYRRGRWKLTAGLRADYEQTAIDFSNSAAIHYLFNLTMTDYRSLEVGMSGDNKKSFFEWMPQLSAAYTIPAGIIYASWTRGYKSGGYNTQIFSDILQNQMMEDLMSDLGIYPDLPEVSDYIPAEAIYYKPEYSWNYELGSHLSWLQDRLHVDAALFYIDLRDQQLTTFPPGQTTGRMMANAGHSRSYGAEVSVAYRCGRFDAGLSYGYTNAKFIEYDFAGEDGTVDCGGLYLPYIPQNTFSALCRYRQPLSGVSFNELFLQLSWQGAGPIYWNETNTVRQDFYGLLNGSVGLERNGFSLSLWGKNLTDTDFNTFYFRSLRHSFVQREKPLQFGLSLQLKL
ncbi:MAG: TonB-dependent receptor [Rikenellaceae bacterium]|nr:TonB-dependent receptor [Rikenellaceae bacterium]